MHTHQARGFTLVETLIYIGFVAVLSAFVIAALLLVMKEFYSLRLTREINNSANVVFERMVREAKNAYDIDSLNTPSFTSAVCFGSACVHDKFVLRKRDPATQTNTTVEFYINGANQLALREGGVEKGILTGKNVAVTAIYVRDLDQGGLSRGVDMSLQIGATDSHNNLSRMSLISYGMILLRGETH
jgi:type II secretory pathway pseudopilin PulG